MTLCPRAFPSGHREWRSSHSRRGHSLIESSLALGIVGLLACAGVCAIDYGSIELTVVQKEFEASMLDAFCISRARGCDVVVALGQPKSPDVIPVRIPPRIKWGTLPGVPYPKGMKEPRVAGTQGWAHARITVTPRRTTTACAWFINNGRDVVCMRVSGKGHVQVLRWRRSTRKWSLS